MIVKGNLSTDELNCIKTVKENIYGLDAVHIHNAYAIGELLLKREFSYKEIAHTIKDNNLDSSINRTINTTFRLNQKAYEVLEEYSQKTGCSKISIIRAIIFIYSSQQKQHDSIKQLKIVSININNFGNLEIKPIFHYNSSPEEKSEYTVSKKKWNLNINNRISLAKRLAKWLIVNQIDIILLNEYDVSEYEYNGKMVKVSDVFKKQLNAYYYTNEEYSFPKDSSGNTYKENYGSICVCFISKQIKKENFKICDAPIVTSNFNNKEWTYARWINIELYVNAKKLLIVGVHIPYGNNDRAKKYWAILLKYCKLHVDCNLIVLGDFNAYTSNDIAFNNSSSENVKELINLHKYTNDAYKEKHPYTPCYSHVNSNIPRRLDYIFVSDNLINKLNEVEYLHNVNSAFDSNGFTDHSGLLININI